MKRIRSMLLALSMICFTACPALAELKVTIINRSFFEIQAIHMQDDGGSMTSEISVVPGNSCVFSSGNASALQAVSIDVGTMLFSFTDMDALAGMSAPVLELSYDADERPHLTLVEKHEEEQTGAFDLEAGPIWNNDHAQEVCPSVLAEWLAANPGQKAAWTGAWATIKDDEMSVCGMQRTEEGTASASPALPLLINVVGKVTVLAKPFSPSKTDFAAIMRATGMDEIRAMGAQDSPLWRGQLVIPTGFLGKTWAALIEEGGDGKPGASKLRTIIIEDDLKTVLDGLAAMDYRPWFAQVREGEDMNTTEVVKFWQDTPDIHMARKQAAAMSALARASVTPYTVDVIFLSEKDYAKARQDKAAEFPGFRLRFSNSAVGTLMYMPDMSALISMTR